MKDRKPKYPGRVKLEPVAGQENVFDMTRADDPEDPGTPMNKQTLLTDEAAADVGLDPDGDYTPNDAFALLGNYTARKPGDILETVRANPGDRWLLCSGDIVREGQYPKLREAMLYNTDWRRVAPFQDFDRARPVYGKPGLWVLISDNKTDLYDANTDAVTEVTYPHINAEKTTKIIGLTYDGDRYVLGVREGDSYDAEDWIVHLCTSTDLVNWADVHQFSLSKYREPYDIAFDGVNILVATEYYDLVTNPDETYDVYVYYTDKALTMTKEYNGRWNPEYLSYFSVLPNGYWCFQRDDNEVVSVRSSGTRNNAFSFSYNGRILIFSEKYWIGSPAKGKRASRIEIYDTETKKKSDFAVEKLFEGGRGYGYLYGGEYNKNTNEWELYFRFEQSSSLGTVPTGYYIAYISADADPNDVTQYRLVRVETLPDTRSNAQMASDRSRLTGGGMLRDPNQKYLPKHSGDTLKYIYTG